MAFTQDSTVREILADERAKAVLERHVPGATTHPQIYDAMYMTLREVSTYPEAGISSEVFQALLDDLAGL